MKIQRPGIHGQLRSDVRILVRMSQAMERRMRWAEEMDLAGIVLAAELVFIVQGYGSLRRGAIGLAVTAIAIFSWAFQPAFR